MAANEDLQGLPPHYLLMLGARAEESQIPLQSRVKSDSTYVRKGSTRSEIVMLSNMLPPLLLTRSERLGRF